MPGGSHHERLDGDRDNGGHRFPDPDVLVLATGRPAKEDPMNFFLFILIGLIAGALAGRIVSGHGFGFVGDIVVGVIGAFLGGWLFSSFLGTTGGGGVLMSLVVAFIGAIVLLGLIRLVAPSHA